MGHLGIAKNKVYLALAQRLDQNPVGAPFNQTLMEILYRLYTETQAEIGSKFPLQACRIDQLSAATGIEAAALEKHLDDMAGKGLVIDIQRKGSRYYMLSPMVIGFMEYTFMRVTDRVPMQELAELFEAYHHQAGVPEEFFGAPTKLFQTWAYESLMPGEVETEVLSYEKASEMIRDAGGGSLTMCYCRHQAQHLGKNCDAPIEDVCTSLGAAAEWLVRRGFARPATTDELLRVLDRTEQLGLVHLADNVQNNPAYLCHCCGCCCGVLRAINEHHMQSVHPSNFIPRVDPQKCTGCGTCVKRCHVKAVAVAELTPGDKRSKTAVVNEDRCLGCGACIRGCKQEAIVLVRRSTIYVPPKNKKEQMLQIAVQKGKAR
ncbi:(Fe-S)-binding protein [Clostridiales bacterium PH28_bin88]|nr:(Fe-S)-binding protein [Clostridiales bacterium PH28_bin88]